MGDFGELDFALVTPDIFSEDTNFVFGMTVEPWKLSVQSIARFVAATADEDLQRASIRHLAKHEFAHMRGLADPEDFDNPQRDAGGTKLYDGHCANTCSLQQVMSVPETFQLIEVLPEDEAGFCVSCVSALISKREE